MIYKVSGVNATQLIQLARSGKLPGLKVTYEAPPDGKPGFDEPKDTLIDAIIEVTLGELLPAAEYFARQDAAMVLSRYTEQPVAAEDLEPLTKDPSVIKVLAEDDEESLVTHLFIMEQHYPAKGVLDYIARVLKENTKFKAVEWQLDREASRTRITQFGIEWPIEEHPHHPRCSCLPCSIIRTKLLQYMKDGHEQEAETTIHCDYDDPNVATGVNVHTHLHPLVHHPDLQIVLPVHPALAMHILSSLVERILNGETYEAGMTAEGWLIKGEGMKMVTFANATERDREVLRVILPDEDGNLSRAQMRKAQSPPIFPLQYSNDKRDPEYLKAIMPQPHIELDPNFGQTFDPGHGYQDPDNPNVATDEMEDEDPDDDYEDEEEEEDEEEDDD